jgi:hypothetical protein
VVQLSEGGTIVHPSYSESRTAWPPMGGCSDDAFS